jgi:hypothetical protein
MNNNEWEGAAEVKSNWFSFANIGDKIKGTLINKHFQKANLPGYQDQWVYELKDSNGNVWNTPVSATKSGTIARLNNCKIGEIIGVIYEKDGEAVKGKKPAKLLKVVTFGMDTAFQLDGQEISADDIAFE